MQRASLDYFLMTEGDPNASRNPILVMVNEATGDKYARAVGQKGLGDQGEMSWLIQDLSDELKSWGHTGGPHSKLILKCDGERSIRAVRDALGKFHG